MARAPESLIRGSADREAARLLARICRGEWGDPLAYSKRLAAAACELSQGFERLLALDGLAFELYEHQKRAVRTVLQRLRGRAILADEVGLGKTIEAGLILREYWVRGLVRDALILVPASLVAQWRSELTEKASLAVTVARRPADFARGGLLLASLDLARQPPNRAAIGDRPWDLIAVDEAHRLKNRRTATFALVDGAEKRFLLLLTATPIQNDLRELYTLITLVRPGQLKTYAQFKREFTLDKRQPKNVSRLRELLSDVVVRTTRREALIRFPRRTVQVLAVEPPSAERRLHDAIWETARAAWRRAARQDAAHRPNPLPFVLLLREACSHPVAAGLTLDRMGRRAETRRDDRRSPSVTGAGLLTAEEITRLALLARIPSCAKVDALLAFLQEWAEPAIVFTEFRATQRALVQSLERAGISAVAFHGALPAAEKEAAIQRFRREGGVLVSTEAGAEGRNLQFCRTVINYDLPWNPMRIEQRIGRVHRLGQERDVCIVNARLAGTVEAYVLHLLTEKIRMFEAVIGDLEAIVAEPDEGRSLEAELARIFLASQDDANVASGLAALGERLAARARMQETAQDATETLFAAEAAPHG